jgi:VWFA-related protein
MRRRLWAVWIVALATMAKAQAPPPAGPVQPQSQSGVGTIRARASLVLVPALVMTRDGKPVFTLKADDFVLTDDGIPQAIRLEEDADSQPLALVVLIESGGDGIRHIADYRELQTAIEDVIGSVEHTVAVVDFDSQPELLVPFTSDMDKVGKSFGQLDGGDGGAVLLDGLKFAVDELLKQPPRYRRAILMLTETHDRGSQTSIEEAVRAVSDNNIAIYSFAFSSTRADVHKAAGALPPALGGNDDPNPAGGCFSRAPDAAGNKPKKSVAAQDYDCLSQLAPPLALAKMAFVAAVSSMKRDVPETVAKLTGGEYYNFKDAKGLEKSLHTLSNHVPNRYMLSFTPQAPHPGLHALTLSLKDYTGLKVDARTSYWAEGEPK